MSDNGEMASSLTLHFVTRSSLSLPFTHCSGAGFTYTQTPLDRP